MPLQKTLIAAFLILWLSGVTITAAGQEARCFLNKKTDAVLKIDHENKFILAVRTLPLMGHRYINVDKGFLKESDDLLIFTILASGGFLPGEIDPKKMQQFPYPYLDVLGTKGKKDVYLKWNSQRLRSCSCRKKQLDVIETFETIEKESQKISK